MGVVAGVGAAIGKFVAAYGGYIAAASAAATAATSYQSSKNQAEAQEEFNKSLEAEAIRQYGELDAAESDAIHKSHADSMEAQKQHMVARSSIMLESAVTGTYGNSVSTALADLNTGLGQRFGDITYRRDAELDQINRTAESIKVGAAQGSDRTIRPPAFLTAASTGISTFAGVRGALSGPSATAKLAAPGRTTKLTA